MLTTIGLAGVGIYLLTEFIKLLEKKFGNTISTKVIVAVLVVIAGAIYYYFTNYQPELREQVVKFALGVFAVSQGIWMLVEGYLPKDETPAL